MGGGWETRATRCALQGLREQSTAFRQPVLPLLYVHVSETGTMVVAESASPHRRASDALPGALPLKVIEVRC